jgi:hypothetical protein
MREIKINDYGDMLATVTGKKLISYTEFGSYQGEWVAVLEDGDNLELWKGYYGSCSGCDWIEAEKNYEKETVSLEKAQEYFKEDRPFLVFPKETMSRLDLETFTQILPANIRSEIYEFEPKELFDAINTNLLQEK